MLSPLSAVQTNTRVTRSRANANATPGSTAKPAIHASPVKANPSPAALGARAPPATPATPAAHIPNAPPPTPASPMFAVEANSRTLAESLGKALSSALAAVPEPMPLSSTPEADLGTDLSRAMEDLVVDPMSDLVAIAIAAPAPTSQVKANADAAVDMLENEDEEDDDASSSFDNGSEETEDDSMGVTNRMKLHGMLPPGVIFSQAAPDGASHTRFEEPESALPRVDASRVHGIFPPGTLSANACSSSHIRFGDDE